MIFGKLGGLPPVKDNAVDFEYRELEEKLLGHYYTDGNISDISYHSVHSNGTAAYMDNSGNNDGKNIGSRPDSNENLPLMNEESMPLKVVAERRQRETNYQYHFHSGSRKNRIFKNGDNVNLNDSTDLDDSLTPLMFGNMSSNHGDISKNTSNHSANSNNSDSASSDYNNISPKLGGIEEGHMIF